jgi:hypothetical protein
MNMVKAAVIGMVLVFGSAAAAQAETLDVKIPFPFTVGTQKMPAGVYRIERDTLRAPSVVLIRGEHGNKAQIMVETTPLTGVRSLDTASLVFVPDENANRLTAIWESTGSGWEVQTRH